MHLSNGCHVAAAITKTLIGVRHRFMSLELRNQNIISQVSLLLWSVIGWLNFLELRDFVIWLPIHSNPMCQRGRFLFLYVPPNELRTNIHE